MACCTCHTHPNEGECCQFCNCAELKKNTEKLLQVENSNSEKSKDDSHPSGLIGFCVFMLMVAGLVVLACWLTVPGFLKPDKEVFLDTIDSYVYENGNMGFKVIVNGKTDYGSVPVDKVDVALRGDGKPYTTIFVRKRDHFSYKCSSATIFVPFSEDLDNWNKFLAEAKGRFAIRIKEMEEKTHGQHVLPSNK